jgi:TATA-binding protein-associated factor
MDPERCRQGAMETLAGLVDELGLTLVPYIVLLIVPVLGRMSDSDEDVREAATGTFAALVRLMPLEGGGGVSEPVNMSESLLARKEAEKSFLAQLMNAKEAEPYVLSVPVAAELRSYQSAGVNWLGFLNRYGLHGILCDDMGLGKTLQTICILGNDHHRLVERNSSSQPLQSLVVCPPTLGGHWREEVARFVGPQCLSPFLYYGSAAARCALRPRLSMHNLVITSYDILRNDVDFLAAIHWNYVVLDEGHVIKNSKSKTFQAVLRVRFQILWLGF